jgi:hypothetical protein
MLIVLAGLIPFTALRAADAPTQVAQKNQAPAVPNKTATVANVTTASNDQLLLDSTLVTGNRELPKVMYIVPWKKANLGDLPGQPFNTLLDETLTPIDREVFQRQVKYYDVIAAKDQMSDQNLNQQATPSTDKK